MVGTRAPRPFSGPQEGRLRWSKRLAGPVYPGPIAGPDGSIYAADDGGDLHAFAPDGAELWTVKGGAASIG